MTRSKTNPYATIAVETRLQSGTELSVLSKIKSFLLLWFNICSAAWATIVYSMSHSEHWRPIATAISVHAAPEARAECRGALPRGCNVGGAKSGCNRDVWNDQFVPAPAGLQTCGSVLDSSRLETFYMLSNQLHPLNKRCFVMLMERNPLWVITLMTHWACVGCSTPTLYIWVVNLSWGVKWMGREDLKSVRRSDCGYRLNRSLC